MIISWGLVLWGVVGLSVWALVRAAQLSGGWGHEIVGQEANAYAGFGVVGLLCVGFWAVMHSAFTAEWIRHARRPLKEQRRIKKFNERAEAEREKDRKEALESQLVDYATELGLSWPGRNNIKPTVAQLYEEIAGRPYE